MEIRPQIIFSKETPIEALFKSMDKDGNGFVTKEVNL